ncbi:MAG: glycosyltransferase family 1 protein, partial [Geminicoccaceae bacterium]
MRILIASDAWHPQINGVVRTLNAVVDELRALGHEVEVLGPDRFATVP